MGSLGLPTVHPNTAKVATGWSARRTRYKGNPSGQNRYRDSYLNRKIRFSCQKIGTTP